MLAGLIGVLFGSVIADFSGVKFSGFFLSGRRGVVCAHCCRSEVELCVSGIGYHLAGGGAVEVIAGC